MPTRKQLRHLTIVFDFPLKDKDTQMFRSAVNSALCENHSVLFHNHVEGGLRYDYPFIQYKRVRGKAAIICIEEGVDVIGELFKNGEPKIRLSSEQFTLSPSSIKAGKTLVQIWNQMFDYRIKNWIPLNSENYEKYRATENLIDKIAMLENVLIGNILSFLKGVGVFVEDTVRCKIVQLGQPKSVLYKGVKLIMFDAQIKTNVSIPQYLGLGKATSIGHGIVTSIKHISKNEE